MNNHKNDRSTVVDRLLAGALARASTETPGACLDPNTLAAWADNLLDADGLAAAEAHAAVCARCQATLGAMVKSAPLAREGAASIWRVPSLGWLIPLTGAAAAVLLWTLVPGRTNGPTDLRETRQRADSTPAAPATDAGTPPKVSPGAAPPADALAPQAAQAASRSARTGEAPRGEYRAQQKDIAAERQALEQEKKAPAPGDAGQMPAAQARSEAERLDKSEAAPLALQAPRASAKNMATSTASAPASPSGSRSVIVSPNPASRWRIVTGGVQRTSDGGSTWQTQNTGTADTLTAGSSPSPSVCWLVGPNGIVVLSTDGRSWTRIAFPEAVPLVSVVATSDQRATVVAADGRRFVTDDGGRTWTQAPA